MCQVRPLLPNDLRAMGGGATSRAAGGSMRAASRRWSLGPALHHPRGTGAPGSAQRCGDGRAYFQASCEIGPRAGYDGYKSERGSRDHIDGGHAGAPAGGAGRTGRRTGASAVAASERGGVTGQGPHCATEGYTGTVEQRLHVFHAVDGDTRSADVASHAWMVSAIAPVGGLGLAVERVGRTGTGDAGVLANGPGPGEIYVRLHPRTNDANPGQ